MPLLLSFIPCDNSGTFQHLPKSTSTKDPPKNPFFELKIRIPQVPLVLYLFH